MITPRQKREGWHAVGVELGYNDKRRPKVGQRLKAKRPGKANTLYTVPRPRVWGMHATPSLREALSYARQVKGKRQFMTRVLVEEQVSCSSKGKKFCGLYRTILWRRRIPKYLWDNPKLYRGRSMWTGDGVKAVKAWAKANGAPL